MKKFKYATQELENLIIGASKLTFILDRVMFPPTIHFDQLELENLKLHKDEYSNLWGAAFNLKFEACYLNIKAFENQEIDKEKISELQISLKDLQSKTAKFIKANFSDLIKNSYNKQDREKQKTYGGYPENMPMEESGPSFE